MERKFKLNNKKGLSKIVYVALAAVLIIIIAFVLIGNKDACGNGVCRSGQGETCSSCPDDCGPCFAPAICGDGLCAGNEDHARCPIDCDAPVVCGDGKCDKTKGEDCNGCSRDCGECPRVIKCGDGACNSLENCWDCPQDCKCAESEYCSSEEKKCISSTCGNGKCEYFESSANCCVDCPCELSDTTCNPNTKTCDTPSFDLSDDDVKQTITDYYDKKSLKVETINLKEVRTWVKTGRMVEVKIQGQGGLKFLLVTEEREVIELPFF